MSACPFKTNVGGLLARRGLTGNCKLYEVLDIDTRAPAEKNTP